MAKQESKKASSTVSGAQKPQEHWTFDCPCGVRGQDIDDGKPMMSCEQCQTWVHIPCINRRFVKNRLPVLDWSEVPYMCEYCASGTERPVVPEGSSGEKTGKSSAAKRQKQSGDASIPKIKLVLSPKIAEAGGESAKIPSATVKPVAPILAPAPVQVPRPQQQMQQQQFLPQMSIQSRPPASAPAVPNNYFNHGLYPLPQSAPSTATYPQMIHPLPPQQLSAQPQVTQQFYFHPALTQLPRSDGFRPPLTAQQPQYSAFPYFIQSAPSPALSQQAPDYRQIAPIPALNNPNQQTNADSSQKPPQ